MGTGLSEDAAARVEGASRKLGLDVFNSVLLDLMGMLWQGEWLMSERNLDADSLSALYKKMIFLISQTTIFIPAEYGFFSTVLAFGGTCQCLEDKHDTS